MGGLLLCLYTWIAGSQIRLRPHACKHLPWPGPDTSACQGLSWQVQAWHGLALQAVWHPLGPKAGLRAASHNKYALGDLDHNQL